MTLTQDTNLRPAWVAKASKKPLNRLAIAVSGSIFSDWNQSTTGSVLSLVWSASLSILAKLAVSDPDLFGWWWMDGWSHTVRVHQDHHARLGVDGQDCEVIDFNHIYCVGLLVTISGTNKINQHFKMLLLIHIQRMI